MNVEDPADIRFRDIVLMLPFLFGVVGWALTGERALDWVRGWRRG